MPALFHLNLVSSAQKTSDSTGGAGGAGETGSFSAVLLTFWGMQMEEKQICTWPRHQLKIQAASEFPSVTHPEAAFQGLSKRCTQGTPVGGVVLEGQAYLSVADSHLGGAGLLIVPLLSLNVRICKMWTLENVGRFRVLVRTKCTQG